MATYPFYYHLLSIQSYLSSLLYFIDINILKEKKILEEGEIKDIYYIHKKKTHST